MRFPQLLSLYWGHPRVPGNAIGQTRCSCKRSARKEFEPQICPTACDACQNRLIPGGDAGHRRRWDRRAGTGHALKTHRVRRQNTGRRSVRATRTTAKRRVEMSAACKYECGSVGHTTEASGHTVPASTASSPWSMFRRLRWYGTCSRDARISNRSASLSRGLHARRRAKTTTVERVDHTLPADQLRLRS